MADLVFKSNRIKRTYQQTINTVPEKVFPLICPVREAEWLENWTYKMIYSESGFAEEGAVFSTSYHGEVDTIWIITKHDLKNYEIQFARMTPNSIATVINISIIPSGTTNSFVNIYYTHTGITQEGNEFVNSYSENEFLSIVQLWEDSMNYFLETGQQLKKK